MKITDPDKFLTSFAVLKTGTNVQEVVGPYNTLEEAQAKTKELAEEGRKEFHTFEVYLLTREGLTKRIHEQHKAFKDKK